MVYGGYNPSAQSENAIVARATYEEAQAVHRANNEFEASLYKEFCKAWTELNDLMGDVPTSHIGLCDVDEDALQSAFGRAYALFIQYRMAFDASERSSYNMGSKGTAWLYATDPELFRS